MKVLIVASYNQSHFAPFIVEQVEALQLVGVEVEYFGVVGKGILGYLRARKGLMQKIRAYRPDIIHAHYGLCGLLANLQRRVPVVTTYHGSDINVPKVLRFSKIAMRLSAYNIFVNQRNIEIALEIAPFNSPIEGENCTGKSIKWSLLPCGVDVENFVPRTREEARVALGWGMAEKKVLFAGAFDNKVKNASLAQDAIKHLNFQVFEPLNVDLIELRGYSRADIANLFYAADAFLMTSFTEGSPQVVKEAMACGCPIVSVDVGDVAERIAGVNKCYIAERTPEDIAAKLQIVLQDTARTNGRGRLLEMGLDNKQVAKKLIEIYATILQKYKH